MARKRLSDLLREEVQKPTEGESELEQPQGEETPHSDEKNAIASNGHAAALEAAEQRETALNQQVADLNQQIADLRAEAKTQAAATKKLQTSLEKAEKRNQHLEAELTDAKQTALQLADSNADLKQQIETLQQSRSLQSQPTRSPAPVAKSPSAPQPNPDSELPSKPLTQQEVLRRRQADSLAHPMFPAGKNPGQFSEQDLGWFD